MVRCSGNAQVSKQRGSDGSDLSQVLHCNHSYHRGPILLLACLVLLGLPLSQIPLFMIWLSGIRRIWRGHTAAWWDFARVDHRTLTLLSALDWAVPQEAQTQQHR